LTPARRSYGNAKVLDVRPLVEDDLTHLRQRSNGSQRLQRIRDSHHMIARLFASGLRVNEIATISGYSHIALSRFQKDPSVIELIAHYRAKVDDNWLADLSRDSVLAIANEAMLRAVRHINDHFAEADEAGELIPLRPALSVASDLMDRFGYGKKSANLNVNVNYAAELEAAIARTKKVAAE